MLLGSFRNLCGAPLFYENHAGFDSQFLSQCGAGDSAGSRPFRRLLRRLVGDRPLNRALHQFARILQGQLVFNVGLIRLHRLHAEVQFLGDLPGSVALADQPENLELPIRQVGDRETAADLAFPPTNRCSIRLAMRSLT